MIIHYQIELGLTKEDGQLQISTVFKSIVDLSLCPERDVSDSDFQLGVYPWYGYCGKITKVQVEA